MTAADRPGGVSGPAGDARVVGTERGRHAPADAVAAGVEVPASSANLGPGFDGLAVALDLTLRVWPVAPRSQRVVAAGLGADELPAGETNLIWRALVAYCEHAGVGLPDVSLCAANDIPLERGLGSSAAAAVAGVALARTLAGAGGADHDLVGIAAGLEGHPDNAAAALLGGLVVCYAGRVARLEPSPALRPVLCVPAERQSTTAARGILPPSVTLADAAANGARAAAVLAGLAGATALDVDAMTDVLHEPARLEAMPASGRLVAALREAGVPACLSGAGPAVLAVVRDRRPGQVERVRAAAGDAWQVRPAGWHLAGALALPLPPTDADAPAGGQAGGQSMQGRAPAPPAPRRDG